MGRLSSSEQQKLPLTLFYIEFAFVTSLFVILSSPVMKLILSESKAMKTSSAVLSLDQ